MSADEGGPESQALSCGHPNIQRPSPYNNDENFSQAFREVHLLPPTLHHQRTWNKTSQATLILPFHAPPAGAIRHSHHRINVDNNAMGRSEVVVSRMEKNRVVPALDGQISAISTVLVSVRVLVQQLCEESQGTVGRKPSTPMREVASLKQQPS